jgi:hypothetical protein
MVSEHVVATGFDDGEGVLVDLETRRYYRLNETAMLIWRNLESDAPFEEIVRQMTDTYDVGVDQATASVRRLLGQLESYKLARLGKEGSSQTAE